MSHKLGKEARVRANARCEQAHSCTKSRRSLGIVHFSDERANLVESILVPKTLSLSLALSLLNLCPFKFLPFPLVSKGNLDAELETKRSSRKMENTREFNGEKRDDNENPNGRRRKQRNKNHGCCSRICKTKNKMAEAFNLPREYLARDVYATR